MDARKVRLEVEKLVKAGPPVIWTVRNRSRTPAAKRAIDYALGESLRLGHKSIGTGHLLLGLMREHKGVAFETLNGLGVDLEVMRREVLDLLRTSEEESEMRADLT